MKNLIFLSLFLFQSSSALAEFKPLTEIPASPSIEDVERKKAELEAQLQVLKQQNQSPEDGTDDFAIVLIPPTMALVAEVITLLASLGLISARIYEILSNEFRRTEHDYQKGEASTLTTLNRLDAIYASLRSEEERMERLGEKYKDNPRELETLLTHVATKENQCKQKQNNNSPESFCDNLSIFFGQGGYTYEKVGGGYLVKKGKQVKCCLEWDDVHCGFEIFNKRGRHQGEVGCLQDEQDPCKANLSRGRHAQAQPHNHRPRTVTCQ